MVATHRSRPSSGLAVALVLAGQGQVGAVVAGRVAAAAQSTGRSERATRREGAQHIEEHSLARLSASSTCRTRTEQSKSIHHRADDAPAVRRQLHKPVRAAYQAT